MNENTKSGRVVWEGQDLAFRAIGGSGFQLRFDSPAGPQGGSPMELVALASAACTASDVISILQKKQQQVVEFEVNIVAIRAAEHPKVFTEIDLEYVVTGRGIDPKAVERAIELSLTKYCSVNKMLEHTVKINHRQRIVEVEPA
ncbi:MAG TPA: OsmC family protein [Anaerolineae bacterium]|nr:OsmC family protein [Anaerolineae bacterium]